MVAAGDAPLMHEVLLEQLVRLYSTDPLNDLRVQLEKRFGVRLPGPPMLGELDVSEILEGEVCVA